MALPDIQSLILDRLYTCALDIVANSGITSATKLEKMSKKHQDLPYLFFAVDQGTSTRLSQTEIEVARVYRCVVLVSTTTTEEYSATTGTVKAAEAVPYISVIQNYFWTHPYLETAANPEKFYAREANNWSLSLNKAVEVSEDTGVAISDRESATQYIGIEFRLNIIATLLVKGRSNGELY